MRLFCGPSRPDVMFRVVGRVGLSVWQRLRGCTTIRAVKESTVEQLEQIAWHTLAHERVVISMFQTPVASHPNFLSLSNRYHQSDHPIDVLVLERGVAQSYETGVPLLGLLVILPHIISCMPRLRRAQTNVPIGLLAQKITPRTSSDRKYCRQQEEHGTWRMSIFFRNEILPCYDHV